MDLNESSYNFFSNKICFLTAKASWGNTLHLNYFRRLYFISQALVNYKQIGPFLDFITETALLRNIVTQYPHILEQTVRNWFYYNSTMKERISLLRDHFIFCKAHLTNEALTRIYLRDGLSLWSQNCKEQPISLLLHYQRSHRKEGIMSLSLILGNTNIYLATFWIANDQENLPSLWLGGLQGAKGCTKIIRNLTKQFYGFRPKSLMIFALQNFAMCLNLKRFYTVSNYGFQASHHICVNRRLKTSLDELWQEVGGSQCTDPRFFSLPLTALRKDLALIPSHKRNLYRNRFILLDNLATEFVDELNTNLL